MKTEGGLGPGAAWLTSGSIFLTEYRAEMKGDCLAWHSTPITRRMASSTCPTPPTRSAGPLDRTTTFSVWSSTPSRGTSNCSYSPCTAFENVLSNISTHRHGLLYWVSTRAGLNVDESRTKLGLKKKETETESWLKPLPYQGLNKERSRTTALMICLGCSFATLCSYCLYILYL